MWGWIYWKNTQILPGRERFAGMAVPADRQVAGLKFQASQVEDHITLEMEDQIIPLFPREGIKLPWN